MKKETLKELGKASFALGNLITGMSVINGLFGLKQISLPQPITAVIIVYIFVLTYGAGIILINKGTDDDWNLYSTCNNSNRNIYICFIGKARKTQTKTREIINIRIEREQA